MSVFDSPGPYNLKQVIGQEVQVPAYHLPYNDDYSQPRNSLTIGGTGFVNKIRDQFAEANKAHLAEYGDTVVSRTEIDMIKKGIDIVLQVIEGGGYCVVAGDGFKVTNPDTSLCHFMWVNT